MQRLGQNHGGYHGERIDIHRVTRAIMHAAGQHGWQVEALPFAGGELLTCSRHAPGARRSLYLSTGIHGDEPDRKSTRLNSSH